MRLWATHNPDEMILIARNLDKAEAIARDLRVRAPNTTITTRTTDFHDAASIEALATELNQNTPADMVLIAHGNLCDQQTVQTQLKACHDALNINATSAVLFAEAFVAHMDKANDGTLALIGSVAGDRGRKSNYVYGASKALVARYAEGLQHRFANTNIHISLIKPGPTDTPMTAELKQQGMSVAPVEQVAEAIIKGIDKGRRVIYAPIKWALIMLIIRLIPHALFKKMDI